MEIDIRVAKIKLLILDVDGVLTDGSLYIGLNGEFLKVFNAQDGMGIFLWHKAEKKTAIITARTSKIVEERAKELQIEVLCQGTHDKLEVYQEIKEKLALKDEEIAYIGDDLIDLPVLRRVGFSATVKDAPLEVQEVAMYVSTKEGGKGAVREIIEYILKGQYLFEKLVDKYKHR